MVSEKTETRPDTEILFPEVVIGDIVIKPWSFGILFDISTLLEEVLNEVEKKNITLDEGFISYVTMARLFTVANTQVLKIMSITLDIPEEKIRSLPMADGIKIASTIARQNWTIIKNEVLLLLEPKQQKEEEKETSEKENETS